ncbi:uncharacterized protein BBOV_IV000010 [Babesia bovis T2Bo]|uniref:Membrane protein, putative n=1 Tax=Babesia bovis TaxID=5865 RepID=A7AUX5_BABBO|nr:uncharacterized protein BBOV_IV000010 [Babesia bovis T2Bo]EDO05601.1 putative integral membrane protein [Babesia bovis T2Bo]|eukprot:XP_001609169.1 hypothetical protein [Babesia bovis T2Bo]
MLVYPVLVLALGTLWPLDWTPTRLGSLSPVTGHYHGTTWAMAEKVTGGDDPEDVVKNLKDAPKGSDGWFTKLAKEWDLVDQNGKFHWGFHVVLFLLMVIFGVMAVGFIGWGFGDNKVIYGMLVALLGVGIFVGLGIAMKVTNKW